MNSRALPLLILLLEIAGCVTMPAPVVSPLPTAPWAAASTWGTGWGFARAHVRGPDGTVQALSTNGDNSFGETDSSDLKLALLMPAVLSLHQASEGWEIGLFGGWRTFGLTFRRHLALDGGAVTSLVGAGDWHWTFRGADASLALEQTVPVAAKVWIILRVGASYGVRDYDVEVPASFNTTLIDAPEVGTVRFDLLRADARVEPMLGVILGHSVIVSYQPYFVVEHGGFDSVRCQGCLPGLQLVDFTQNWGFTVAVTWRVP